MKIRRYNEQNDILDISSDKVAEILEVISSMISNTNSDRKKVEDIHEELSSFKSDSNKSNDQIDDAVSNLELVKAKLNDALDLLDNISQELKDYSENGRKYLY